MAARESADGAGRAQRLPLLPGLLAEPGSLGREVPGLGRALPAGAPAAGAPAAGPHHLAAWGDLCPRVTGPNCAAWSPRCVSPASASFPLAFHSECAAPVPDSVLLWERAHWAFFELLLQVGSRL